MAIIGVLGDINKLSQDGKSSRMAAYLAQHPIVSKFKNQRVFLLAGGSSLENIDLKPLKNELTIAICKSRMGDFKPTLRYMMDYSLHTYFTDTYPQTEKHKRDVASFKKNGGIPVLLEPASHKLTVHSSFYIVKRIPKRSISLDLSQGIYCSNNSGASGLMLAIALGAKQIYLLGYDLKIGDDGKIRHHDGYRQYDSPKDMADKLHAFAYDFYAMSAKISELGIEVVNLSPQSALGCFEKRELKDIFNESCIPS